MHKPLRKLMSCKTLWTQSAFYQNLFNKVRSQIKDDACMKFYDETKPKYLETNVSGIGFEAALLQTRDEATYPRNIAPDNSVFRPITCASKSLTSAG